MASTFLVLIFFLISSVKSAHRCFQCSSTMDSLCTDPIIGNLLTHCLNNTEEIKCFKYKYKINGENQEYIVRGCRAKTDSCDNIKDALKHEHKTLTTCEFCTTDLCNNVTMIGDVQDGNTASRSFYSFGGFTLSLVFCVKHLLLFS